MEKARKAFTLVELLIVIAIIGILATVIFISLNSARKKAQDTQVKSDVTSLSKALEIVRVDRDLGTTGGWTAVKKNLDTKNDSNISRWTDGGALDAANTAIGTGKPLVQNVPVSPISGGFYEITITANGYAIMSKLNGTHNYFCSLNGNNSPYLDQTDKTAARNNCAGGL